MKRRIEYVVRVHYTDFLFESGAEALSFATIAAQTVDEPAEDIEIKLRYFLIMEEEE